MEILGLLIAIFFLMRGKELMDSYQARQADWRNEQDESDDYQRDYDDSAWDYDSRDSDYEDDRGDRW